MQCIAAGAFDCAAATTPGRASGINRVGTSPHGGKRSSNMRTPTVVTRSLFVQFVAADAGSLMASARKRDHRVQHVPRPRAPSSRRGKR
jgi:hypothetical protein